MSNIALRLVKKVCKDQELKQSEPKSSPQNQNGKYLILQIVKIQREHMVNRVSSYFPKGGHSATETELKNMNTRKYYTQILYIIHHQLIWPTLHPRTIFHWCQFILWDPLNAKKFNLKKKLIPAMCNCMVSMATHSAILKNGGVTTKSIISQLLLSLDYKTWYQIKA